MSWQSASLTANRRRAAFREAPGGFLYGFRGKFTVYLHTPPLTFPEESGKVSLALVENEC